MYKNILLSNTSMSIRCLNLLKRYNIKTLNELLNNIVYMHYSMEKYRNLGIISINEIDSIIEKYGYNIHDFLSFIPKEISESKRMILNEFYINKNFYNIEKVCFKYGNGYLFYTDINNQAEIFKFQINTDIEEIKILFKKTLEIQWILKIPFMLY